METCLSVFDPCQRLHKATWLIFEMGIVSGRLLCSEMSKMVSNYQYPRVPAPTWQTLSPSVTPTSPCCLWTVLPRECSHPPRPWLAGSHHSTHPPTGQTSRTDSGTPRHRRDCPRDTRPPGWSTNTQSLGGVKAPPGTNYWFCGLSCPESYLWSYIVSAEKALWIELFQEPITVWYSFSNKTILRRLLF